jgi:hypothetical protein
MTAPQGSFAASVAAAADQKLVAEGWRGILGDVHKELLKGIPEGTGYDVVGAGSETARLAEKVISQLRRARTEKSSAEHARDKAEAEVRDLRARLAIAEQRRAEAQEARLAQRASATADLPDLPESFIRAATAALGAFAEGYAEYGPGAADSLGIAGQWGDLHRKVAKLKPVMWGSDPARLTRETPQEILRDIIGHCLLALEMYERGMEGGRD